MKKNYSKIHPSALISPIAVIHPSVEIGPFCIIEDDVIIGENSKLSNNIVLKKGTQLGKNNLIASNTVIGGDPQDLDFDLKLNTGVIIGDNNVIRENVTIHRATMIGKNTLIGNDNYLMCGVHVAHDCVIYNKNTMVNNTLLGGHVKVFNQVFLSGGSLVHQKVKVGEYSIIGAGVKVTLDVPPFCMAPFNGNFFFGLNLVGLRRNGFLPAEITEIKNFYKFYYKHIPRVSLKLLSERKSSFSKNEKIIYEFIINSKIGVLKPYIKK